jgi:hypothetical protein
VRQVRVSEIEEYETEEGEVVDDDLFYRSLSIETDSGVIEFELSSSSRQALEVIANV